MPCSSIAIVGGHAGRTSVQCAFQVPEECMPLPFQPTPEPRGIARLVGRRSRALRELEDLLARAERLRDVTPDQVRELAARHGVDLARELGTARRGLYRRLLEHCLQDQLLSAEESDELAHLRQALSLPDADAAEVNEQVAHAVYGRAIDQVLADGRVDPEEAEFLRRLGRDLALAEPEASRLLDEGAGRARDRFIARTAAHDSAFVAPGRSTLELHGTSETSIEQAVAAAVEEAARAVPALADFEVTQIRGTLDRGRIVRWEVSVRAHLPAPR
jgi:flavin-binding protein dodecin